MAFFVDVCPPTCTCGRYDGDSTISRTEVDRCCKHLARGNFSFRETDLCKLNEAADDLDVLTHKIMRLWAGGHTIGPFQRCPIGVRVATLVSFVRMSPFAQELTQKYGCAQCGMLCRTKPCPCKAVRYCSEACQKKDWRKHKKTCRHRCRHTNPTK